jgi:alkylation response protein AidB-like acyl-CoA dehydrogenase
MSSDDTVRGPNSDDVRAEASAWLEANWDPRLTVRAWWVLLAESGWGHAQWPKEWFGRGLTASLSAVVREVFASVGALGPPHSMGQRLGQPTLLTYATPEQNARFIPELARGEAAWCQLFSEPGAGSDLASAQTRAVRDGERYVVNGQKMWTSEALFADRGMLLARTDPTAWKHRGLTYFIIDMDQPGIEVRPIHDMAGGHQFNEVFFSDAVVGVDRVIGTEHAGWPVALTTLMFERSTNFRVSIGFGAMAGTKAGYLDRQAGEVALEASKAIGVTRVNPSGLALHAVRSRGSALRPDVRQAATKVWVLSEVNRLSQLRSAAAAQGGAPPSSVGSIGKLARTLIDRSAADAGMRALGAEGMLVGPDTLLNGAIQHLALSVPASSIAGGTDEIQRNIVGERVLGLPKEPAVDRDVPFNQLRVGTQPRDQRSSDPEH